MVSPIIGSEDSCEQSRRFVEERGGCSEDRVMGGNEHGDARPLALSLQYARSRFSARAFRDPTTSSRRSRFHPPIGSPVPIHSSYFRRHRNIGGPNWGTAISTHLSLKRSRTIATSGSRRRASTSSPPSWPEPKHRDCLKSGTT